MAAAEIGVSSRAAMPEGAIQTDVAQIKLIITLKNCHFDRSEKSALHPLRMRSRFLPAVEMTVIFLACVSLEIAPHARCSFCVV